MATLKEIILREPNPFDPATFTPGNFWDDEQTLSIDSIHQAQINEIESILSQVSRDHRTRSVLLRGDPGAGKSHLLGRLKDKLISKAHFVYIDPYPNNECIWSHILRYTIDGLAQTHQQQEQSQLLLWLQSLDAYKRQPPKQWTLKGRKSFIQNLKQSYPIGIYNSEEFFGVLYDLTNPKLYSLACEWMKGDDVSEETLKALKVKNSIDTEDAAQKVLSNFGRLSKETAPIVICFDNLDNIPRLEDGNIDLQGLLNVNSSIHTQKLKNFLIIISSITSTWNQNINNIRSADKDRITYKVDLHPITFDEAELLWEFRLKSFHQEAKTCPTSPISPLTRKMLEKNLPSGKTTPRYTLEIGRKAVQLIKNKTLQKGKKPEDIKNPLETFRLIWHKEFGETQKNVTRVRHFSPPEYIKMMQEMLEALGVQNIKTGLLKKSKFSKYSLSYQQSEKVGIIWTDEPNMKSFFHAMKFCEKVIKENACQILKLVRSETTGKRDGHKLFMQIFKNNPHTQIKTDVLSVQYLATYHNMVNDVLSKNLVVEGKTLKLDEMQDLVRRSEVLNACPLLQHLDMISPPDNDSRGEDKTEQQEVKNYLCDIVKTQQIMSRQSLIKNAVRKFNIDKSAASGFIDHLIEVKYANFINPDAKPEEQLICYIPESQ